MNNKYHRLRLIVNYLGNEKRYQVIVNQELSFITKQQLILLLNVLESRYVSREYLADFGIESRYTNTVS
ncbi:hypothetical protein PF023_06210 [Enterococcus thailandicus]|uniref:hypothetical protein n=1 Tax=Enterococcus thailandicus TaxID=417368 RepID=UPI0022EBDAF2|nr:hypothetical protein [Enterococcus thailandicus]MDA3973631.1 hypothetical protein [Enterococcus thailandicus]MDA3975784.1 hypothetical protein [Enterococcus thailandicus]MDA3981090.1 hypothetical protein [Enterococcus thailandicus]